MRAFYYVAELVLSDVTMPAEGSLRALLRGTIANKSAVHFSVPNSNVALEALTSAVRGVEVKVNIEMNSSFAQARQSLQNRSTEYLLYIDLVLTPFRSSPPPPEAPRPQRSTPPPSQAYPCTSDDQCNYQGCNAFACIYGYCLCNGCGSCSGPYTGCTMPSSPTGYTPPGYKYCPSPSPSDFWNRSLFSPFGDGSGDGRGSSGDNSGGGNTTASGGSPAPMRRRDAAGREGYSLKLTCGQGHTRSTKMVEECEGCPQGTYKEALDNSSCLVCPRHATSPSASITMQQCVCKNGYSRYLLSPDDVSPPPTANFNASASSFSSDAASVSTNSLATGGGGGGGGAVAAAAAGFECVLPGHVPPDPIKVATSTMSLSIVVIITAQITVSVSASVSSAIASQAGAGGAQLNSLSSPQQLISQVQLLSVAGRIGGAEGQDTRGNALALFSSGFEWANYKFRTFSPAEWSYFEDGSRRNLEQGILVGKTCGIRNAQGSEGLSSLIVMAIVLSFTSFSRLVIKAAVDRWAQIGKGGAPAALLFPAWEGPVFMTQVMALGDVMFLWIGTGCPWWMVGGYLLLAALLVTIIYISIKVTVELRNGDVKYQHRPPLSQLKLEVLEEEATELITNLQRVRTEAEAEEVCKT